MTKFKCYYCGKPVDTINEYYFHSVTHDIYFHLPCSDKYETEVRTGKIKPYYLGESFIQKAIRKIKQKIK